MDTVFVVLHVVTGVFLVGPMAILPMVGLRTLRAGESGAVASTATSVRLFTLLSLIVVVLGFGALGMSDKKDHFSFSSTWVWLSLVAYVVSMVITLAVVVPALRRSAAALASGGATAGEKAPGYSRIAAGSGVSALLLVLIVVLMVWKP